MNRCTQNPLKIFLIVIIFCNAIFGLFFKSLPAAQKFWPKQSLYSGLGELRKSKIDLVDLKERSTKFPFFFENPPPPSKKS